MRPTSWMDVPAANPTRGARYTPGGLSAWRSVVPVSSSRSGRSGASAEVKRQADRAIKRGGHEGINFLNLGGKALLGALDVLDTPRAAVASTINQLGNAGDYGGHFDLGDLASDTRRNITLGEALGVKPGSGVLPTVGAIALESSIDPLSYIGGAAAHVGPEAGKDAARQFLKPAAKEFLGEAAVSASERSGVKFADAATRAAEVARQGEKLAAEGAQKTLKYKTHQVLDALEREAIGAEPGTHIKIPGSKHLGIDRLIEKVLPDRVVEATRGGKALRITEKELGLGKLASKARAKIVESGVGNRMAEVFVKNPELRKKILFGTPEEAAISFMGLEKSGAAQLQRRVAETTQGGKLAGILQRMKKAGVNGEDLRYSIAEAIHPDEVAGDSSARVLAKVTAAGDPDALDEMRQFFSGIEEYGNSIDPELPWLQHRANYTTRTPSEEAIALRGGEFNAPGGPLRRETFDFKRKYGLEPDQVDELMGEKLLPPSEAGGRSVDRQIDDILEKNGVPNYFEKDAYKAFPDYVRRFSKRYGDEWMAKQFRDLGIAQPGWVQALTDRGMTQGRVKAAIQSMTDRAAVRAEKARVVAQDAERASIASEGNLAASQGTLAEIGGDKAKYTEQRNALDKMSGVLDPTPVKEYEGLLRDHLDALAVERQGLLDNVDMADVNVGMMNDAQVQLSKKIAGETSGATARVTELESAVSDYQDQLGDLYDRMDFLNKDVTPTGIGARKVLEEMSRNEATITDISEKMRNAEHLLGQFEDLAQMPTDSFDKQLEQIDGMLAKAQEQYAEDPRWVSKVEVLADQKATLLHQKGVIERARGRLAELDRSDPSAWIDELDALKDANSMGDKIIHSIFPDLPDEVNGLRIRDYFNTRMPELQKLIDDTSGQVMSAFSDRDTMRAQLGEIRAQKRLAEKNLRSVTKDASPKMREIWQRQSDLLEQADAAAKRALEIEDELRAAQDQIGTLDATLKGIDTQEQVAEMFVAQQHAKHLQYEATAQAAETNSVNAKKVQTTWEKIAKNNLGKPEETALKSALNSQYRQLGAVSMIGKNEAWLVDGLRSATVLNTPNALKPVFNAFDRVQNLWKGYALSTPGAINRNLFGGVFNNWLAGGVEATDYAKTLAFLKGGGRGLSDADRAIFNELEQAGLMKSAGSMLEVERKAATPSNFNPLSTDNKVLRTFRKGQEDVEGLLRGTLGFSTMRTGGNIDDAIGRVVKYHFDYDDLSAIERSVFRRVVPFYTWTRKNFPLMLEQIVKEPAKFTRFYQMKNEIERQSPEETLVPSYFAENLGVRLPFKMDGARAYMLPDLPFTSLNDVTDPSVAFSQVTPFVKTPIEYAFGKQFFKGIPLKDEYQPVPKLLSAIPGAMAGLDAVGLARRGPNGWSMKQKDLYVLEQFIPSYGKARRLFPSEPQYNERMTSSWLSFALGAGIRVNTKTEQRNEAYKRIYSDLESANSRRELGYADYGTTDEGKPRNPPSAYALYNAYTGTKP